MTFVGGVIVMKHYFPTILICVCLGFLASGCLFGRQKINVEDFHAKAATIVPGKTTGKEAMEAIGSPPNAILQLKDEKAYVYTFGDGRVPSGEDMIPIPQSHKKTKVTLETTHTQIAGGSEIPGHWARAWHTYPCTPPTRLPLPRLAA